MPAIYAHDRFGQDVIPLLSGTVNELVTAERAAFDLGLQGPDILLYYQPLIPNDIRKIGDRIHSMPGRKFFARCVTVQRKEPNDSMLAYLLGSVCHYTLDSCAHPIVEARCREGDVVHTEVEMAFDRSLMVMDGLDPLTVPLGQQLAGAECAYCAAEASRFYPPLTEKHMVEALKCLVSYQKVMLAPSEAKRKLMDGILTLTGPSKRSLRGHIMSKEPIQCLQECDRRLKEAYEAALPVAAERIASFLLSLYQKQPLGEVWNKDYNGNL